MPAGMRARSRTKPAPSSRLDVEVLWHNEDNSCAVERDGDKLFVAWRAPLSHVLEFFPKPVQLNFTKKEQEAFKLVANDISTKEIAEKMGISLRTAKFHLSSVYHKLGISGRNELLRKAYSRKTGVKT